MYQGLHALDWVILIGRVHQVVGRVSTLPMPQAEVRCVRCQETTLSHFPHHNSLCSCMRTLTGAGEHMQQTATGGVRCLLPCHASMPGNRASSNRLSQPWCWLSLVARVSRDLLVPPPPSTRSLLYVTVIVSALTVVEAVGVRSADVLAVKEAAVSEDAACGRFEAAGIGSSSGIGSGSEAAGRATGTTRRPRVRVPDTASIW